MTGSASSPHAMASMKGPSRRRGNIVPETGIYAVFAPQ